MGRSTAARAERRAEELRLPAIREALSEGNPGQALALALHWYQAEAARVRRRRPADGALIDAYYAGVLARDAAGLYSHKPARRAGCPRVPRPADLLAMFERGL